MKIVCAWCKKEISHVPDRNGGISHGICMACFRETLSGIESLGECMTNREFPLLVENNTETSPDISPGNLDFYQGYSHK